MKQAGKIALFTILCLVLAMAGIVALVPDKAEAGTIDNARIAIPLTTGLGASDGDNLYIIFVDTSTGYMADDGTGATALDTVWLDAAVEGSKQSTADTGTNTMYAVFDPPPLDKNVKWAIMICENSSPANTDVPLDVVLYDVSTNSTYTDANRQPY